jgi:hypothetical protein
VKKITRYWKGWGRWGERLTVGLEKNMEGFGGVRSREKRANGAGGVVGEELVRRWERAGLRAGMVVKIRNNK